MEKTVRRGKTITTFALTDDDVEKAVLLYVSTHGGIDIKESDEVDINIDCSDYGLRGAKVTVESASSED
jgi:hypothetical protein